VRAEVLVGVEASERFGVRDGEDFAGDGRGRAVVENYARIFAEVVEARA
jgi:hypothetical protein